ncbi:MAG: cytosolic protein [Candidatus Kerfeldbacteria bacterium]|nr:cytosolic protein [Candidatus Kerfeldbacteria bacterium]
MNKSLRSDIFTYVESNIGSFHASRLNSLANLALKDILLRKNPYLFKAKNILTAQDLVKTILDAHLSSQEETLFGSFLEELAIFINGKVYGGQKSSAEGIDLEFVKGETRFIVNIKSGPNWGNSSQIKKMVDNFKQAKRILQTNTRGMKIVAINGCCYGKMGNPDQGDYLKYCGQQFWEFISGDANLYVDIIEPLGRHAKEKNEEFTVSYSKIINKFTLEFGKDYCVDGVIDWQKLLKFNSGK